MSIVKFVRRIVRRIELEITVTDYVSACGGPVNDKEARRQARELILQGRNNNHPL